MYKRTIWFFDTTLSASDPLRFRKKLFFFLIKMIVTDQIKILDKKIKQYDLESMI